MTDKTIVRFSPWRRAEHFAIMVVFILLCVTGLPQKFFEQGWARATLELVGGVERARWLHRAAGLVFAALTIMHLAGATWLVAARRARFTLVPERKDFTDAIMSLKYYLGLTHTQPRFDRYDYRQKFEYWGMVLGALVVIVTGVVLLWPTMVARYLPGQLIPASKVAHSNEGLMAFLVIIVWHIYNAHLSPDVFPFDSTIFTGRISEERMRHEHPLEYERLAPARGGVEPEPTLVKTG
jgi:formate dehydrogenase subunit gamma